MRNFAYPGKLKKLISLLGAALLLLFSACIDIEQTLTLNEDGSGILSVRYIFDEKALEELSELLEPDEALFTESELVGMIDTTIVTLTSFSERKEHGSRIIDIVYSFKDIDLLSSRWCDDYNHISREKLDEYSLLTWSFAAEEEPKENPDSILIELDELFSDHHCTFTIEAPFGTIEANESAKLSQDRKTAQWKFPLSSFMNGDTLRVRAKVIQ